MTDTVVGAEDVVMKRPTGSLLQWRWCFKFLSLKEVSTCISLKISPHLGSSASIQKGEVISLFHFHYSP